MIGTDGTELLNRCAVIGWNEVLEKFGRASGANIAREKIILHRYWDPEKRVRICVGFEQFICLLGFLQSRIAGKRDVRMQFLFGLRDSPKNRQQAPAPKIPAYAGFPWLRGA